MKNKLPIIPLIITFCIIIFVILYINVFSNKNSEIIKQEIFYNVPINTPVKENIDVGYRFIIDSVEYVHGEYNYDIETFANDKRLKTLNHNLFSINKKEIVFSWRETEPPFQIIKKERADTLYIIKNGKKFSFPKVHNSKK